MLMSPRKEVSWVMGYNIQNQNTFDTRKKLIQEYLQNFLESPVEVSSIHLNSDEVKWVEENYPQIKLSFRKDVEKLRGRNWYTVTKNTPLV